MLSRGPTAENDDLGYVGRRIVPPMRLAERRPFSAAGPSFVQNSLAASKVVEEKAAGYSVLGDPRPAVANYLTLHHLNEGTYPSLAALIRDIAKQVQDAGGLNKISAAEVGNLRNDMYLASEAIRFLQKDKDYRLTRARIMRARKAVNATVVAHGEFESEHPGYCGAQDTFYVGNLKGVGRVYQQTFSDTYAKVACAKLYDRKTPITAADLLNDRVIPFFDSHEVKLLRVLTDRGSEYCGNPERHEYELYLAIEDIDHSRTKTKSPQTNGICERFHKTVLNEFYRVAFRKRVYRSIDELQADLDVWIREYNEQRPHQGRWCFGKTPMRTFLDAMPMTKEKMIAA
jgi:transposase InsO family protein